MKLADQELTAPSPQLLTPELDKTTPVPITVETEIPETTALRSASAVNPAELSALAYDPEAIQAFYRRRPLQVWRRWFKILWPLMTFMIGRWWERRRGQTEAQQRRRAIRLRQILTQLGPAYIKIGQALSTRPDLVPPVYLEELVKLQDQLPPFSNQLAYQFIEEELGQPPAAIYAELSPDPIAAASLGQVYKGKLFTGETVAVKVQRPGLAEAITLDVHILRGLAAWAQKTFKTIRSDLVAILDEFAGRLFEEMDYTHEGHNAERFAMLYGQLPDIYVPKIYWDYTRRRVLTMEWITGTKLTRPEAIQAQGIDARYLIEVGVQCSLRQLLEHGFFHADPHPGNLLAMSSGKLAYLDFGMMSEIEPQQRYGLINAIVHIVNRDFEALVQDYVQLGFLSPGTDVTPIVPALATVFNNALGASVAELNFQSIVNQLSALMYEYPFRVPAYYALIIRSLVTMEGIAISIDPNFKVLSSAYPYVSKRLLTDPAPELRSSLRDLLFKGGSFRWNRLENLLRNARDNSDYDFSAALQQALDFLFSERGTFIRDRLADEIVQSIDLVGRNWMQSLTENVRHRVGLNGHQPAAPAADHQTLEHLRRIWAVLQDTPGFDPFQLLPVLGRVLVRPETQKLGSRVASGLAQKAAARVIRELLAPEEAAAVGNGRVTQVALPPVPASPLEPVINGPYR